MNMFFFCVFLGADLTDVFQEVRKKDKLVVHCGIIAGCLYRTKYENGKFWEKKK